MNKIKQNVCTYVKGVIKIEIYPFCLSSITENQLVSPTFSFALFFNNQTNEFSFSKYVCFLDTFENQILNLIIVILKNNINR